MIVCQAFSGAWEDLEKVIPYLFYFLMWWQSISKIVIRATEDGRCSKFQIVLNYLGKIFLEENTIIFLCLNNRFTHIPMAEN